MCSIQDDGLLQPPKGIDETLENTRCTKCPQAAVIIIRVDHTFCKDCFLAYATHKFRSAFGKSRLVRDGEKVLVAFSGGNCSTALLHLCLEGKSPRAPKKLRFQPSLIYVDEGAALGLSVAERQEANRPILEAMHKAAMPCYVCSLEQALSATPPSGQLFTPEEDCLTKMQDLTIDPSMGEQLRSMLNSARTLTAKENLLHTLRMRLLVSIAISTGHTKVIVGDSCTRLSVRLLSSITQGRGAHIANEMAFGDGRFGEVMVLRPMRDFLAKEIVMYNTLQGLQPTVLPTIITKESPSASLDRLTEHFLNGLQAEFPATVSTVFRTGTKLDATMKEKPSDQSSCVMCQMSRLLLPCQQPSSPGHCAIRGQSPDKVQHSLHRFLVHQGSAAEVQLDQDAVPPPVGNLQNLLVRQSRSSPAVVEKGMEAAIQKHSLLLSPEYSGKTKSIPYLWCPVDICRQDTNRLTKEDLTPLLCYGCRLILRDVHDVSLLPAYVKDATGKQIRRNQMRDSIQEFLLEDESG